MSRPALILLLIAILEPVAVRAQHVSSPYLDLVWRYREGDYGGAVAAVVALPSRGLRELVAFELYARVCGTLGGDAKCRGLGSTGPLVQQKIRETWLAVYPAALLLHIEAADNLVRVRRVEDGQIHRQVVRDLLARMHALAAASGLALPALTGPRRQGQLLLIRSAQGQLDHASVERDVAEALKERPDDVDLLLAAGWVDEFRARSPVLRERHRERESAGFATGSRIGWMRRERSTRLSRAEEQYRAALRHDASSREARLRLGRVLALADRFADAQASLADARGAGETKFRYLAALFLADVHERAGKIGLARESYQDALREWPGAQSARLGLSRLLSLDQQEAAARTVVLLQSASSHAPSTDPWFEYDLGQWWHVSATLAAARQALQK